MKIPLTKPVFDENEERAVNETLRSGWVTQGPRVLEFEQSICEFTGAKYGIATTSATTALFLSLHVLNIGHGDEVIVPSLSFIATVNPVIHVNAKPIFVDIDPKTYNIDPSKIEKAITKNTKAIIPVNQIGLPCDLDAIYKIAKKYKLHVIEDSACALGSVYKGKKIGSFGEITVLSFHPRKPITTGEGGMILTNNKILADKCRTIRNHGMSVSDLVRHKTSKVTREKYNVVGYNFKLSDIQAAIGIEQMKKLPKLLKKRNVLAKRYTEILRKSKVIIPPYVPEGYIHNWQSYVIRITSNKKIDRDTLMQKLLDQGISTRAGIMASHLEPVYKKLVDKVSLPITEKAAKQIITLPLFPEMTQEEQDFVISWVFKLTEG